MKPKIPRAKSASVGAILGVAGIALEMVVGMQPVRLDLLYWLGVALTAAIMGVGIGGLLNLSRR